MHIKIIIAIATYFSYTIPYLYIDKPRRHTVDMYAFAILSFTHLHASDLDLWRHDLENLQQCPLTWWIFMFSLYWNHSTAQRHRVTVDRRTEGRMDGRTIGKRHASRHQLSAAEELKQHLSVQSYRRLRHQKIFTCPLWYVWRLLNENHLVIVLKTVTGGNCTQLFQWPINGYRLYCR